jgi:hypothetical protein
MVISPLIGLFKSAQMQGAQSHLAISLTLDYCNSFIRFFDVMVIHPCSLTENIGLFKNA